MSQKSQLGVVQPLEYQSERPTPTSAKPRKEISLRKCSKVDCTRHRRMAERTHVARQKKNGREACWTQVALVGLDVNVQITHA
eukprot:4944057-Pleurochrysis_carterae.AAC.5